MHILGQNCCFFGSHILIFLGESKGFGTHLSENHLGTSFALFFSRPFLGQNAFFWGREQNFWYPQIWEPIRHLFYVESIDRRGPNRPPWTKMCNSDQWPFYPLDQYLFSFLSYGFLTVGELFSEKSLPGPTAVGLCLLLTAHASIDLASKSINLC